MKPWLLARLREPSTWRGLVWILTVSGVLLTTEQAEAIMLAGMALAGLLGVFLSDTPSKATKAELPPISLVSPAANRVRLPVPTEFDPKIDGHGFGDK
jgi:hypothetical protein